MSPLSTYLWKEWREQRATLAVLAVALLVGITAVVAALPKSFASDPLVFQGSVAIALLATLMSTGSDLLARERSGTGLGFLERLPAGLATAFCAKLVFFALALAAAALYGALLATAAALIRSGELPSRLLEGAAPWILAALIGLSLWVFAVSAWMPASALTFPGTVLLLAALAWPAVLAVKGDSLFRPTPDQGLAFALLCLSGAPVSAWAAFVVGSRLGRPRRWAALGGLAVAALFFAPTWAWAARRYASLVNAPFEIIAGWVGANGRFAFLDLTRPPPAGVDAAASGVWDRCTALVVDLEERSWRLAGELDASAFLSASGPRIHLPEVELSAPLRLLSDTDSPGAESAVVLLDKQSARVLGPDESRAPPDPQVSSRDFGLEGDPEWYSIYPAGSGHRLSYADGKRRVELYRQGDGAEVFDAEDLPLGETGRALYDVRVRRGRWIARDVRHWVWVDPRTGECGRLEHIRKDEWLGPLLQDDRVVVVSAGRVELLDPDSGVRVALGLRGDPPFEIRSLHPGSGFAWSPLPVASPTVVLVSSAREMRLALLDVSAGTLVLGPSRGGGLLALLWSEPPQAIVLEDRQRLVRYDFENDEREVLFSVDELD